MAGPGIHQFQNLTMQQVLAPQLQQSLQILQAPALELRTSFSRSCKPILSSKKKLTPSRRRKAPRTTGNSKRSSSGWPKLDEEWRDYMAQNVSYSSRNPEDEERRQFFFDSIASQETLQQHLWEQLNTADVNESQREAAELIIGNMDDLGFLQTSLEDISKQRGPSLGRACRKCSASFRRSIRSALAPETCENVF